MKDFLRAGRSPLLSLACVFCGATGAAAFAPDVYEVCGLDPNGDNFLALRSGPSSNAEMIARLAPRTTVEDSDGFGREGKWYQIAVDLGGSRWTHGWVWSDYLCVIEDH